MPKQQESAITVKALSRVSELPEPEFTKRARLSQKIVFFICFFQLLKFKVQLIKSWESDNKLKKPSQAKRKIRWEAEIHKL